MQSITVAAIQMNAPCGKINENLKRHEVLARKAADQGAELILFPELSISGHFTDRAVYRYAEEVPCGPSYQRIEALAKDLGVVICTGIAERRKRACFNTQFLAGPDGFIGKYSKTHASRDEYFYFSMGNSFPIFDLGKCKVGILICYDITFPEVARILALNGAEVILAPHASRCGQLKKPQQKERNLRMMHFFEHIGHTRAIENGAYMVMCNQVGDAGKHLKLDVVHAGGVVFTRPDGSMLTRSRARTFREEIVVADLEANEDACPHLRTRRPEIYQPLTDIE